MNNNCPYLEMQCESLHCDCAKYKAYVDAKNDKIVERVLKENNFDISLTAWELLMQMQRSFASRIRKVDNPTKEEVDKWVDKYLICVEDEIREVREHLVLYSKNDKNNSIDIELKKEVIDILHFMLDLFIVGGANTHDIQFAYDKKYNVSLNEKEDLIDVAYNRQKESIDEYLYTKDDINKDITILKASCRLSDACASVRQQISWKHWKKPNDFIDFDKLYLAYAEVFHEFINLCILTMNVNEIKDIYIHKNIENILRQEYGY